MHHATRFHISPTSLLTSTCALLLAVFLYAPSQAQADIVIGADGTYGSPVGDWASSSTGGTGTQLRLGYELPVPGLRLVPELVGLHQEFGSTPEPSSFNDPTSFDMYAIAAGLRIGIDGPLRPSIFGHIGYGQQESAGVQTSGEYLDAGVALDFTVIPMLNIGVSGTSHFFQPENQPAQALDERQSWLSVGAHLEVVF